MIFHFKLIILVHLLWICNFVACEHESSNTNMKRRSTREEITDITKTLTDAEIEMALSDLSLADLNALSKLIDSANADTEYNYSDDSFIESNERPPIFEDIKNDGNDNGDYDDSEPQATFPESLSMSDFKIPGEALATIQNENARAKREDSNKGEGTVDEEYLKLLENSFPHGAEQNDRGDSEIKKDHIRVKRD